MPQQPNAVGDADAAWAAIPESMRPADVLPDMKTKLLVPDVKKGGIALFSDIVTINPGDDITFCTYTGVSSDKPVFIHDTAGSQTRFGHHAILQYSTTEAEKGTRPCDAESTEAQQGQILGGSGGEGTSDIKLPPNVVSEIPAGAQFIINHHWINVTEQPIQAQTQMITVPPDSTDNLIVARGLAMGSATFNLPPRQTTTTEVTCMFEQDTKFITVLGHQHSWGRHVKAERVGSAPEMIFDHDYDESMISHPQNRTFSVEEPYTVKAGDGIHFTCTWDNTTDEALSFPREMCIMFGWQIGAATDKKCFDGVWFQ
jgi:hypothetical protein